MPYLATGSIQVFYQTYGTPGRPAIVLLHGLGSAGDDWPLQVAAFAPHFPVITVDAPGHGRSDQPSGLYPIWQMAADVAALLDRLEQPSAHLVGLSLGGCIALQIAIDHPARARSLVLVNSFARLRPAGWRGALRFARRLWLLAFAPMPATAEAVARDLFPKPEHREFYRAAAARLASNSKRAYQNAVRALLAFDARPHLGRVRCPALVVVGDRDLTVPLSAKVRLQQGIPGARLAVIRDSGHAPAYDQAEEFNRIVLDFLQSVDASE
jgi:pimeloyl-ACP methyl ester carboxylesterase